MNDENGSKASPLGTLVKKAGQVVKLLRQRCLPFPFTGRLCVCFLMFLPLVCAQLVYAEGFKLGKVGARYEPELRVEPVIMLPQTDINAGIYQYELDDGSGSGMVGFLNGEEFNFVDAPVSGDVVYAISSPYFLLDATTGGTSRNGLLFLFKFDKAGVKFLDVIGTGAATYFNGWYVEIMFNSYQHQHGQMWKYPALGKIEDTNHDGILEIEVLASTALHFDESFVLHFDIARDKLRLNLNPILYNSLFMSEKQKFASTGRKSDAFYIYGFLTKNLDLKTIKIALKNNHKRKWIINFLNDMDRWDAAFHDQGKFTMKKIYLGRTEK